MQFRSWRIKERAAAVAPSPRQRLNEKQGLCLSILWSRDGRAFLFAGATDLNRNHAPVCVNQEFVAPVRPTTDFRANEIDSVLRGRNDKRKDAATLQAPGRLKVLSGDYEDAILSALIAPNNNGVFRNQRRQPKFRRSRLFLWTHEVLSFLSLKIITILQQTDL